VQREIRRRGELKERDIETIGFIQGRQVKRERDTTYSYLIPRSPLFPYSSFSLALPFYPSLKCQDAFHETNSSNVATASARSNG
jgi:hypothetical protein